MAHNSDRQDGLKSLREWLEQVGAGSIEDIATLTSKLVNAWPALAGGEDEGMTAAKLGGRVEAPTWAPPVLTFFIERHGGIVLGSTRAERHAWEVNIEEGEARCRTEGYRQLRSPAQAFRADPAASQLAEAIRSRTADERLKWRADGSVDVLVGKVLPSNGPQQTMTGRRKRLRAALEQELFPHGWTSPRPNRYMPPAT